MSVEEPCRECAALAAAHEERFGEYLTLVDIQYVLFENGWIEAAKKMDASIQAAMEAHRSARELLAVHENADHGFASMNLLCELQRLSFEQSRIERAVAVIKARYHLPEGAAVPSDVTR